MQQLKRWVFGMAISYILLWGMWASAADTVLFDPESYQASLGAKAI